MSTKFKFVIQEALTNIPLPTTSHKIVIAGLTDEWNDACYNWVIDSLSKKMNLAPEKFPNISVLKQKNDWAFPRTCNHPNALVLLEGVDNSDAIKYFIERQQGKVLH